MNELFSSIKTFIRRCHREYDIATECLQLEDVTMDKYTFLLAKITACHRRLIEFELGQSYNKHTTQKDDSQSNNTDVVKEQRINARPEQQHNLIALVSNLQKITENLKNLIIRIKNAIEEKESTVPFEAALNYSMQPGRPSFIIEKEQLLFLREYNFNWTTIASLLGVSRSVLYRRRKSLGIANTVTVLTDDELDELVKSAKDRNPQWGAVLLEGYLLSQGITVPRTRIVSSMSRVDPLFSSLRWRAPIERRRYQVPGPGSLWHIDGNHKLVRYGVYIHGGIDGYSRVITFMKASSNNKSETVFEAFRGAIEEHNMPSRIRTDHGTENVLVGSYMEEHRPDGHNAWLTGSSVHNQRIERLWRDLRHAVLNYWRDYFFHMEQNNLLDVQSQSDITALHHIFLPVINSHISQFSNSWNNHKLRTEHQCTPWQLYIRGMLRRFGSNYTAVREVLDDDIVNDDYGIDVNFDDAQIEVDAPLEHPGSNIPRRLLAILEARAPNNTERHIYMFKRAKRACQRFYAAERI